MNFKGIAANAVHCMRMGLVTIALSQFTIGATLANRFPTPNQTEAASRDNDRDHRHETRTPIKHVIVIIGENRSFDHVFATYVPKHDQFV